MIAYLRGVASEYTNVFLNELQSKTLVVETCVEVPGEHMRTRKLLSPAFQLRDPYGSRKYTRSRRCSPDSFWKHSMSHYYSVVGEANYNSHWDKDYWLADGDAASQNACGQWRMFRSESVLWELTSGVVGMVGGRTRSSPLGYSDNVNQGCCSSPTHKCTTLKNQGKNWSENADMSSQRTTRGPEVSPRYLCLWAARPEDINQ